MAQTCRFSQENRIWELWIPYTVAFGLWFNCIFIRMHNLYLIHIRATIPFSLALQSALLDTAWLALVCFLQTFLCCRDSSSRRRSCLLDIVLRLFPELYLILTAFCTLCSAPQSRSSGCRGF